MNAFKYFCPVLSLEKHWGFQMNIFAKGPKRQSVAVQIECFNKPSKK